MTKIQEATQQWESIRTESRRKMNTASRIGAAGLKLIEAIAEGGAGQETYAYQGYYPNLTDSYKDHSGKTVDIIADIANKAPSRVALSNILFIGAKIKSLIVEVSTFDNCDFSNATFIGLNFGYYCTFNNCNFTGATGLPGTPNQMVWYYPMDYSTITWIDGQQYWWNPASQSWNQGSGPGMSCTYSETDTESSTSSVTESWPQTEVYTTESYQEPTTDSNTTSYEDQTT